MANAKQRRAAQRAPQSAKAFATQDSFANFAARVGLGTANQAAQGRYNADYISRNRLLVENSYRSSWICGMAVDCVAEDMTRAGVTMQSDIEPDEIETLERAMVRLRVWDELCDTLKWGRLYGGAIAVMLVDGQKLDTPLNTERVSKGQFKGLLVLDRWQIQPSLNRLVQDLGPEMGQPEFYDVLPAAKALAGQQIHYTRVIRMDGIELPHWQRIAENLWGQSVLERLWDRLLAFDSTTQGAAQLVYKAHLRTLSIEGLRELIAMGGKPFDAMLQQIDLIRAYQSNEGMTLLDAKDKFEAHSYTFSGLDAVLLQFGQQISGALQIPLVRLFGQSPAGLNSTGESDIRNYYDKVAQQQDRKLRTPLMRLFAVLHQSELGRPMSEGFTFEFTPLWQLSDVEKSQVAANLTTAVVAAEGAGLVDRSTALQELRHSSQTTGLWGHISDEQIEEAENDPPPAIETGDPDADPAANDPDVDPDDGQAAAKKATDHAGATQAGRAAVQLRAAIRRLTSWIDRLGL